MKESCIQKKIIDYLNFRKIFFWRNHTTGIYDPVKKKYRTIASSDKGIADLLGSYKGRLLAIEVKNSKELKYILKHYEGLAKKTFLPWNKTKQHFHEQIIFIERVRLEGGRAGIAASIEDAKNILSLLPVF